MIYIYMLWYESLEVNYFLAINGTQMKLPITRAQSYQLTMGLPVGPVEGCGRRPSIWCQPSKVV